MGSDDQLIGVEIPFIACARLWDDYHKAALVFPEWLAKVDLQMHRHEGRPRDPRALAERWRWTEAEVMAFL